MGGGYPLISIGNIGGGGHKQLRMGTKMEFEGPGPGDDSTQVRQCVRDVCAKIAKSFPQGINTSLLLAMKGALIPGTLWVQL